MPKLYKTSKLKKRSRTRTRTRKNNKSLLFDAAKVHPASIQLRQK